MRQRGFGLVLYLIAAGIAVAAIAGGIAWIYSEGRDAGEAEVRLEWKEANEQQRKAEERQINKAATGLEVERAKEKIVFRTITQTVDRLVDRPIYRNVCLDDDGLRLARCAIRGEGPDRCKPDEPVRRTPGSDGRDRRRGLALDYGDGGILSGLRGQAEGSG